MLAKLAAGASIATISAILALLTILNKLTRSVGTAPPTKAQLEEENHANSPLFRHLPHLKSKLAWREVIEGRTEGRKEERKEAPFCTLPSFMFCTPSTPFIL
jgi:hypothetical protein